MKTFIASILGVVTFLGTAHFSSAASLYIDPAFNELNRGDGASLAVRIDTDEESGECINAIDGVLTYSENIVPVDVSIGSSILNVWVEKPTINTEDRTITFAGGIPNGYCGRVQGDPRLTNILAEIIFRSPGFSIGNVSDSNVGLVEFAPETTVYLNNGLGTKADLKTFPARITLDKNAGSVQVDPWKDRVDLDEVPPEEFSIEIQKDNKAFGGKYFIVFSTTDKQTGIDQYQVIEESVSELGSFNWGRADAPWVTVRSPYVLNDQSLNSVVRVKAIDKAGNEYVATLIPDKSLRSVSMTQYVSLIGFSLVGLIVLTIALTAIRSFITRRKRNLKETNETENDDVDQKVEVISKE